ncbi:MAG: FkbM family methyltransferase [Pseudomonadota bacterium]
MWTAFLVKLIGKKAAWRLGRKLYMQARGDVANDMARNGEHHLIQRAALSHKHIGDGRAFRVWDVGANLGNWSQYALDAARDSGCEIIIDAFEPAPDTFQHLLGRFGDNASVKLHQVAMSSEPGTGKMNIAGSKAGTNALVREDHSDGNLIDVTIITGDIFSTEQAYEFIDLIKIDAEGHDLSVISGMSSLLAAGKVSVVQFEYNHLWLFTGASLARVFDTVKNWPYDVARVTSDGLEIFPRWNPEMDRFFECNYALVRRPAAPAMRAITGTWDASNVYLTQL